MSWLDKYSHKSAQQSNSQPKTLDEALNVAKSEAGKYPGMSYHQAFIQMCKERNTDPNDPINTLMQALGGKR